MDELKFQKLTPTQEVDLSGYEDAFHYIFAEDDIRNIAISGAYSSGKSSVIESYKKKHPEKTFMHLSLAHFQALDEASEEIGADSEDEAGKSSESVIEGKILNQLIQQIPAENIPLTNFRIKRSVGRKNPIISSLLICTFIALTLHMTKFDAWTSTVAGLKEGWIKYVLEITTYPGARIVSGLLTFVLLGFAIFKLIQIQHSRNILRKISVQGNEIEIFSDNTDSYFDKYLNEVLYLFENADVDGIVFEDIDRFDNHTIFERLREINTLTNVRILKKKDKKPLRFFYLLRDDIFENKDRTKFFDYILPIVPVLDSSNSYNKIKEFLEEAGVYSQFDDHFLRGVSLYIDDLRIVKNVFNEFQIYNRKLNDIELDPNKLFAIIVYKNIFPKDFAELQLNRGFVHTLFNSKGSLIAERIESINGEISAIEERIAYCEQEHLKSQKELDLIKSDRQSEANRYYQGHPKYKEFEAWCQGEYKNRKQAIEDRKEGKLSDLQKEIELKKDDISMLENLQLADLLNRDNTNAAFQVEYINEIGDTNSFNGIKGNPYFSLLKYLISRGYLDETYSDYMTFFYPNSLSLNDKVFLRSITDRMEKAPGYPLDNPRLVTDNLNEYDFSQRETLNFALSEYILLSHKENYVRSMVAQIAADGRYDYISGYLRSEKEIVPMVLAIDTYWPEMLREVINSHALSDELLKLFTYHTLENGNSNILESVNIDGCVTEYISGDPQFMIVESIDVDKVGRSLEELQVSFVEIDHEGVNEALFDFVYRHNLYDIDESNIRLMLESKCGITDVPGLLPALLTFLYQEGYELCAYLWENKDNTLSVYLGMFDGDIQDKSETIVEIVNSEDIDQENKETYVKRLGTLIELISEIETADDQKMVMSHKKIVYSSDNILYFFDEFGLTGDLVAFINSDTETVDYLAEHEDEDLSKFLDACLISEKLDDGKYRQIIENLCDVIQKLSIEGLSEGKLGILIDLDRIEMNLDNLRFMRNTYPEAVLTYIRRNIEKYISVVSTSDYNFEEAKNILEWKEVDDQKKIELLQLTKEPIKVEGKSFSDDLLIFVLENNLNEADLPWIVSEYSRFSDNVRDVIKKTSCIKLRQIVANYSDVIDDALLLQIFKSDSVNYGDKLQLLGKTARKMNRNRLCEVLTDFGDEKIADNLNGGKKRVKVTNDSEKLLKTLFDAGVIYQYAKVADGQTYKTVKYRPKSVVESLPDSLL